MQHAYLPSLDSEALPRLLAHWHAQSPTAGCLALLPEAERSALPLLQEAARRCNMPLLGGIFPAVINAQWLQPEGVALILLDPAPCYWLQDGLDQPDAAARIAQLAAEIDAALPAAEDGQLFLICDAMLPDLGTHLTRLHQHLGLRFNYAGVSAGSESFTPMDCLFDNSRCLSGGCLAILLPAATPMAVRHAYPVSSSRCRATSTTGNRIDQIDGKPALAVYQALVKTEFGIDITPENFYQYAVHFPFGLVTVADVLVRIPVALTDEGHIHCIGQIHPNSLLRLLHPPTLAGTQCANELALALGESDSPLLAFYCAGRRLHFGIEAEQELHTLQAATGASTLLGALSLGEIGTHPDLGIPEFHNAAIVCLRPD